MYIRNISMQVTVTLILQLIFIKLRNFEYLSTTTTSIEHNGLRLPKHVHLFRLIKVSHKKTLQMKSLVPKISQRLPLVIHTW